MAYAHIASAIAGDTAGFGPSSVTTAAINTTGANLLVLLHVNYPVFTATPVVSDSKSNTWTGLTGQTSTNTKVRIYYVQGGTVGTGHTFTVANPDRAFPSVAVFAFSGSVATPFDQQSGTTGTGTTANPGSLTPSETNCLVMSIVGTAANRTFTCADLTGLLTIGNDGQHQAMGAGYVIQTSAAAINPTWNISSSDEYAVAQVVFKDTPTAAGGQPTMRRWGGVPHMAGGQQFNTGDTGRMWGRRRSGLIVPSRFQEAA